MTKLTLREKTPGSPCFEHSLSEALRAETPFKISTVLQDVVVQARPAARKKNLDFDLRLDDSTSEELLGTPHPLRQALSDLVLNAIRFTPYGRVAVSVRRIFRCDAPAAWNPERLEWMFSFGENGLTLSRKEAKRLFRPLPRPDAAEDRTCGGSGFGLAVAKKIVDLMGGKFHLFECSNGGLAIGFSATFSGNAAKNVPPRFAAPFRETAALRGKRILLAEDNEAYRIILSHFLKKTGVIPVLVSNGHRAVEEVRKRDFDLVLMDVQMPLMDGLQAARVIRTLSKPKVERLPIVAMIGFARQDEQLLCVDAGMNDFLEKPVESADLHRVLGTWLVDPVA